MSGETSIENQQYPSGFLSFMPPPNKFLGGKWTFNQYQILNISILQMCQRFQLNLTKKYIVKKSYDKFLILQQQMDQKDVELVWDLFTVQVIKIFAPEYQKILEGEVAEKLLNIKKLNKEMHVSKIKDSIAACIEETIASNEKSSLNIGKNLNPQSFAGLSDKIQLIFNLVLSFPESLYLNLEQLLKISEQIHILINNCPVFSKQDPSKNQKTGPIMQAALQFKRRYLALLQAPQKK